MIFFYIDSVIEQNMQLMMHYECEDEDDHDIFDRSDDPGEHAVDDTLIHYQDDDEDDHYSF